MQTTIKFTSLVLASLESKLWLAISFIFPSLLRVPHIYNRMPNYTLLHLLSSYSSLLSCIPPVAPAKRLGVTLADPSFSFHMQATNHSNYIQRSPTTFYHSHCYHSYLGQYHLFPELLH